MKYFMKIKGKNEIKSKGNSLKKMLKEGEKIIQEI
jgi:hypothetical protein